MCLSLCSAYGEGAFLMAETILILCLALHYSGRGVLAATFIVAYAALCSSLFIYRLVPSSTLLWGQLLSAPIVIAGRVGSIVRLTLIFGKA